MVPILLYREWPVLDIIVGMACIRYYSGNGLYQILLWEWPVSDIIVGMACIRYYSGNGLYQIL